MIDGPVQLLVLGFAEPEPHGEILAELARLRESDVVRLIDSLVVFKEDDGTVRHLKASNLTLDEATEAGATIGALIGLGAAGEDGAAAGALLGAVETAKADGHILDEDDFWFVDDAIPPGSAAAIALLEHRWAIGLRKAVAGAGGALLAESWVHAVDLVAVGLVAAEQAGESAG